MYRDTWKARYLSTKTVEKLPVYNNNVNTLYEAYLDPGCKPGSSVIWFKLAESYTDST